MSLEARVLPFLLSPARGMAIVKLAAAKHLRGGSLVFRDFSGKDAWKNISEYSWQFTYKDRERPSGRLWHSTWLYDHARAACGTLVGMRFSYSLSVGFLLYRWIESRYFQEVILCSLALLTVFSQDCNIFMGKRRKVADPVRIDADTASKLASLQTCSVSQAATVVLALTKPHLRKHEDEYKQGMWHVKNASKAVASKNKEQLLQELPLSGGIYITNLPVMLEWFCDASEAFSHVLMEAAQKLEPLDLVIYWDETCSGNVLNPISSKKCWLLYAAVKNMKQKLTSETFWWPLTVIQSDTVSYGDCSLSEITRLLFLHWKDPAQGVLGEGGFAVRINQVPTLIRLRVTEMITDEAAMKTVLCSKGAAGLKPCCRCANIVSRYHGDRFELKDSDVIRDVSESDPRNFIRQSDADIFHIMGKLQDAHETLPACEVDMLEKTYGWKWEAGQLVSDPFLREVLPPSACLFDFLHVLFSNGTASMEVCLFWEKVQSMKILTLDDLQGFATSDFRFAKKCGATPYTLKRLFDARLIQKSVYAGDASQTVLALFILEIFARLVCWQFQMLQPFVDSLLNLCDVCRWYFRAKHGSYQQGLDISGILTRKISRHIESFRHAYGRSAVKPKHHYGFHCAEQVQVASPLLDCWALERKHKCYKDVAKCFPNKGRFAESVLNKLLMVQRDDLKNYQTEPYLESFQEAAPFAAGVRQCWYGKSLHFEDQHFQAGDLFLWLNQDRGGIVKQCLLAKTHMDEACQPYLVIADLFLKKRHECDTWHLSEWQELSSERVVCLRDCRRNLIWPLFWWQRNGYLVVSCWQLSCLSQKCGRYMNLNWFSVHTRERPSEDACYFGILWL